MAANKTTDTVKLNLRLPKGLHRRLQQQARRHNVSLNTEIIHELHRADALAGQVDQKSKALERGAENLRPLLDGLARQEIQIQRLSRLFADLTRVLGATRQEPPLLGSPDEIERRNFRQSKATPDRKSEKTPEEK